MRLREHSAVQSKSDMFSIDPRKLRVDENYNVRDMNSKETREHIAKLKASIAEVGVKTPLEVRIGARDQLYVVAGHCRLEATLQAIKEGAEIRAVPCIPEAKGTSEQDRTLNLILSNDGMPLSPLEKAKVVKRLTDWKWEPKDIAARLGWKSAASVRQHLEMLELKEPVKQHIRDGEISATLARRIAKGVDPEKAEEMIRANLAENARIKGKRTRVTPRQVKAATRPKPPAAPAPAPAVEEFPPGKAPQTGETYEMPDGTLAVAGRQYVSEAAPAEAMAETVSTSEPAAAFTPPAEIVTVPPEPQSFTVVGTVEFEPGTEVDVFVGAGGAGGGGTAAGVPMTAEDAGANAERGADPASDRLMPVSHVQAIVSASRQGIKDLIDALKPFHDTVNDLALDEYTDDDLISVPLRHLKRAHDLYSRSVGDDIKSAA